MNSVKKLRLNNCLKRFPCLGPLNQNVVVFIYLKTLSCIFVSKRWFCVLRDRQQTWAFRWNNFCLHKNLQDIFGLSPKSFSDCFPIIAFFVWVFHCRLLFMTCMTFWFLKLSLGLLLYVISFWPYLCNTLVFPVQYLFCDWKHLSDAVVFQCTYAQAPTNFPAHWR